MDRLRRLFQDLSPKVQRLLGRIDRRLGGIPLLLKRTLDSYNAHDGLFISAAMAYYFFFTLFPLILALITLASLFIDSEQAKRAVIDYISRTVPVLQGAIIEAVNQVLQQRGPIGILAGLGFVYAASGLFGILLTVVDRAWGCRGLRSTVAQRALAAVLVLLLAVFFFLSIFLTTLFEAAQRAVARALGLGPQQLATSYSLISLAASLAVTIGLFLILYWKLPATRVRFADALPAAIAAGLAWEAVRWFFAWYLSNFATYTLVYGSFAAIIGFLAWLNLTGFIVFLGAELSAQIAIRRGRGPTGRTC